MASVVTGGQRMIPGRALELGYEFQWPELDRALEAALR
jgi:NAD dependent epimerase/dehydratase family enzyme